MVIVCLVRIAFSIEALQGEVADRLQHPEAGLPIRHFVANQQAVIDEVLDTARHGEVNQAHTSFARATKSWTADTWAASVPDRPDSSSGRSSGRTG